MLSNASPNLAFRVERISFNRQLFLWPLWLSLIFCSYLVNVDALYFLYFCRKSRDTVSNT